MEESITVLNLKANVSSGQTVESICKIIVDKNADVVCLQEIIGTDLTYTFYDSLKDHFAHFYITGDLHGFSADPKKEPQSGVFIASKYVIDNPQYIVISQQPGYIDFVITRNDIALIHFYVAQLHSSNEELDVEVRKMYLQKIIDQIESKLHEGVPHLLCRDLRFDEDLEENKIEIYFDRENTPLYMDYVLLFNSLPAFLANGQRYELNNSSVCISDNLFGLISSIKKIESRWETPTQLTTAFPRDKEFTCFCASSRREEVSISHEKDENGNSSVEFRGSIEKKKGNNYFQAEVFGKKREENGKSKVEGGGQLKYGKEF